MHEGHRKRMMERAGSDPSGLQDHELLEIILYGALPRVNTNPIAHELLSEFGSLGGVLSAPVSELCGVKGIGQSAAAYLGCMGEICKRADGEQEGFPEVKDYRDLHPFIVGRLRQAESEVLEFYCLDQRLRVKSVKRFTDERLERATIDPEQVGILLATRRPYGVVVAHNHPIGACKPSAADDKFTAQIQLICSMNNVSFYDHIIVCPDGESYSYFRNGRMDEIKTRFDLNHLLEHIR